MVEAVSPGPRLELFARRARPGWTVWGNEVEANDQAQFREERA
jgi:N6-adenosine-specific RNA methylase IME4